MRYYLFSQSISVVCFLFPSSLHLCTLYSSVLHFTIILSYISYWNIYCMATSSACIVSKNVTLSSSSASSPSIFFFFNLGQLPVPTPDWCSGATNLLQHWDCKLHSKRLQTLPVIFFIFSKRHCIVIAADMIKLETTLCEQFLIEVRVSSLHSSAMELIAVNTSHFICEECWALRQQTWQHSFK